jgi:capsular polysaccharide biosynthesis protein
MRSSLRAAFFRTADFLVRHDSPLASPFVHGLAFLLKIEHGVSESTYRLRAEWLDKNRRAFRQTLAPESVGHSYGPLINGSRRTEEVRLPAVKLYEFENAVVGVSSSSFIVDNTLIMERAEGVALRRCSYAAGHIALHGRRSAFLLERPIQRLDAGIFLGGNGSSNYYHWMIEILPKMQFLPELDARYPGLPLLVSEDVARTGTFRESLEIIANDRPIVVLDQSRLYDVARLVHINAPNVCPFNLRPGEELRTSDFFFRDASIAFLRDRLRASAASMAGNPPKRVFFGRKGERRRYNEEEIYAAFAREGFVRVFMDELNLRSQIDLMTGAEMIAGPTGASWTNLIFCREGTLCLCWMADESREFSAYSNLAKIVGVDLRYVTYPTGAKSTQELYSMDYRVDAKAIEKELAALVTALDGPGQPSGHAETNLDARSTMKPATSLPSRLARPVAERLLRRITGLPTQPPSTPSGATGAPSRSNDPSPPRPRPHGRMGFLFHTPELLNHFSCVMDLLPADSFDLVVCLDAENSSEMSSAAARRQARMLTTREVISSGKRYDYLVSNHPIMLSGPSALGQLAEKNVRFMYAAGKSGWNLSDWNSLYDLILCFGPYHAAEFAKRSDAVILQMGYPRLDGFFNGTIDVGQLQRRFHCDPAKQTVVWLPTWKTLSSVGHFDRQVSALTATYNVVVKLHPLMLGSEPERVTALQQYPFTDFIADASDNLPLYLLADFMLFDYGGPPFAAIYTDKRMLLLNVPNAANDPLTGEDSPDISIRQTIVNIDAEDGDIARLLADDDLWEAQKKQRQALRKQYFAPYYGFSAQVAALALSNLDHILKPRSAST